MKSMCKIVTIFALISIVMLLVPSSTIVFSQPTQHILYTAINTSFTSLSTFNPNIFLGGLAYYGILYAWTTVLNITNQTQMIPQIVENWTFSPPNWIQEYNSLKVVNVTLHLNPAYHWANGQPVTAYDVMASYMVINILSPPPFNYTIIDNYTLKISLPKSVISPYELPLALIYAVGNEDVAIFIHYDIWKPVIDQIIANWTNILEGNRTIIRALENEIFHYNPTLVYGQSAIAASYNGPFYVAQITSNEVILNKNPYYPYASRIPWDEIVAYQITDPNSLVAALESGKIDVLAPGMSIIPPPSYLSILPSSYKVVVIPNPSGQAVYFNFANPWLRNVTVRQAIAYVLNRTAIALAGGPLYIPVPVPNGIPNFTFYSMFMTPAVANLNPYNTNLNEARALLQQAGFTFKNGRWYTPNQTQFTLTLLLTSNSPDIVNQGNVIASELTSFGIPTTVEIQTSSSVQATLWQTGQGYDMAYLIWGVYEPGTVGWFRQVQFFNGYPNNVTHWNGILTLPNGTTLNVHQLWLETYAPNSTEQLIDANDALAYGLNYYLPELPIVERGFTVIYNTQTVSLPSTSSWAWPEIYYGSGGGAWWLFMLELGLMQPVAAPTTTTTVPTATSVVSTTVVSTVSGTATTSVPSIVVSTITTTRTPTAFYAAIAVLIVIVIVLAVLLARRR